MHALTYIPSPVSNVVACRYPSIQYSLHMFVAHSKSPLLSTHQRWNADGTTNATQCAIASAAAAPTVIAPDQVPQSCWHRAFPEVLHRQGFSTCPAVQGCRCNLNHVWQRDGLAVPSCMYVAPIDWRLWGPIIPAGLLVLSLLGW